MIRHEIPTHLDVEDKLLGPLTSKDALTLLVGVSAAYGIGTSGAFEPSIRLAFVALVALVGVAFALVKIEGRPLEEWLLATLVYLGQPRRVIWRPRVDDAAKIQSSVGWYPYRPRPRWQRTARYARYSRRAHERGGRR